MLKFVFCVQYLKKLKEKSLREFIASLVSHVERIKEYLVWHLCYVKEIKKMIGHLCYVEGIKEISLRKRETNRVEKVI